MRKRGGVGLGDSPLFQARMKTMEAVGRSTQRSGDQPCAPAGLPSRLHARVSESSRSHRGEKLRRPIDAADIHSRKLGSQVQVELSVQRLTLAEHVLR